MKQYKQLLRDVQQKGTYKSAAREGMPGTTSLFGYQFRHNLADGFPLLTTKQVPWKGVVVELLWFLRGDTNIKYLDENNVRYMWHEDAYNYYVKIASQNTGVDANNIYLDNHDGTLRMYLFDEFCHIIANNSLDQLNDHYSWNDYTLGDCGAQYGELWRRWQTNKLLWQQDFINEDNKETVHINRYAFVDQITDLIDGLKKNPMGRRHILTAWNPATLNDMALNACHAMAQWNCRPLSLEDRKQLLSIKLGGVREDCNENWLDQALEDYNIPKYHLDCQLYQRSADVFLGVPLNIASYALLTEIFCKICNMVPGDFIHTFGDVHIYDNHKEQVELQLTREERELSKLRIVDEGNDWAAISNVDFDLIEMLGVDDFQLEGYDPHPKISGKLSTGLK